MSATRRLQIPIILSFAALAVTACDETSLPSASLRPRTEAVAPLPFGDFTPIAGSAVCGARPAPATPAEIATYQPFILPEGFVQRVVTTELDPGLFGLGKGVDNFDMITLNENGPQVGRFLYRTHEVGSNGSVSETDLWTGTTRIIANAPHYEALDGIVWSPWGTLLFAEERGVASLKDPAVPNAVGGLVYEWDPATGISTPLPAVGTRSHEGMRFDAQGNLYGISESTPGNEGQSGAIFKFVPDKRGDLSSGQLYALKVADASKTGPAVWVALDRDAVKVNSDAEAIRVGATGWARPEDIDIATSTGNAVGGANVLFVATTTDDLVLRIVLSGDQATVSDYVREDVNVDGLSSPDNLALDGRGRLFIAEDNGPGDIWVATGSGGPEDVASSVVRFASLTDCAAEPTGIYFDLTGKVLYVHVQHAGAPVRADLTIAITRTR